MDIADFLGEVTLFSNLTERSIRRLSRACSVRAFGAKDHVVRQGDEGVKTHPEIALEIFPVVVRRFRETNEKLLSFTE